MAHFALCSRTDMPLSVHSTRDTAMGPRQNENARPDESLTSQQQEDLGIKDHPRRRNRRRKAPEFAPVDLNATPIQPKTTANIDPAIVQQPEIPAYSAQPKAHGKARIQPAPYRSKQSTPTNSPAPPQSHDNIGKKHLPNRKIDFKGKSPGTNKVDDMTAQPSRASIPPHLRKSTATQAQAKVDVRLGDFTAIVSQATSDKSQAEKLVEHQAPSSTEVVFQERTPHTPPTTVELPSKSAGVCSGWNHPIPEPVIVPSRRHENSRWPREPKVSKERHVWPKSREIPKELSSGSQSDGGVAFKSSSEGDPSYDVKKLMDWNGDWLPPPEEWAARKGFTHRHFGQVVEQWANEHSRNCTTLMDIDSPAFLGVKKDDGEWLNKELVPRYWLHDLIENTAPRKFWEELPQRAPAPLGDVDIMEAPPYWERWEDDHPNDCFMTTLAVPEARINPKDSDNELESRFAMLCTTERLARIKDVQESRQRRDLARRKLPDTIPKHEGAQLLDRRLQPKTNIYLRPVQPADIHGIMTIYNHYVNNTVHAAELGEQTEAQIRCRIDTIVQAGLPCLVAVAKRNQRRGPQGYVSETIAGFAHLDDYVDLSMYRFTFELELYIHPGYVRQGIGRCLLDQVMYIANSGYNQKGGYEWINDFEYLKNGKSRVIKTILASLHYERGGDVEWATSYLGDFGFKKAGRFTQVGHKIGKVVDKIIFQAHTTEVIDPKSIPMVHA